MVSDIVLLKELSDFIKNSVEAYIGCLSGAIMKDEYLNAIKTAGFQEVRIVDETSFPVEYMANSQIANKITENFKISPEKIGEVAGSVMSIKVCGFKPN